MAFIYFARTAVAWQGDGLTPETAFRLRRNPDRGMISFCPPGQGDPTAWPVLAAFSVRQPAAWNDYLFAADLDEPLTATLAAKLETRFGITLSERVNLRQVLRELFVNHARTDGTRWAPLQPSHILGSVGKQYEIWLAGQLVRAWPHVGGGAEVFSDAFTRADSSTVGGNWTERQNDAQIKTNRLSNVTVDAEVLVDNSSAIGSANYEVEADVDIGTGGNGGPTGRISSATADYYLTELEFADNGVRSYKRVAGSYAAIGTPYIHGSSTAKIKLSMNGTTIKVYVNDVERDSFTDSAHSAEGDFGARLFASIDDGNRIDNYKVYDFAAAGGQPPRSMHQFRMRRVAGVA